MKRQTILVMSILLVCTGVSQGGQEIMVDGVVHVRNSTEPARGRTTLDLEELWRVGNEDDELFFGLIVQVLVDEAGNLFLLDEVRSQVFVLSPEGQLITTLGREGEGPGEVTDPNDMVLLPDGRVGLAKAMPGALVTLDRQGGPAGDIRLNRGGPEQGGMTTLTTASFGGGNLVGGGTDQGLNRNGGLPTRESVLASYSLSGERLAVYNKRDIQFGFQPFAFSEKKNLQFDNYRLGTGLDGRVYCAPEYDPYRINIYQVDGPLERVIEREQETVKRTTAEYQTMFNLLDAALRRDVPPPFDLEVAPNEPGICWMQKGLQVAHDGRLWVLPSSGLRHQPDGVFLTFDVFSADGHFEEQVSIPGEGDPRNDAVFLVGPDHLVRIVGFVDALLAKVGGGAGGQDEGEAEPIQVVYYRIR